MLGEIASKKQRHPQRCQSPKTWIVLMTKQRFAICHDLNPKIDADTQKSGDASDEK